MSEAQKPVATVTFRSRINRETAYNETNLAEDTESTMDFYIAEGTERRGWIEWDMPELDMGEEIGIWFDHAMELTDYDGVFALPAQAVALLEKAGITVSEGFR